MSDLNFFKLKDFKNDITCHSRPLYLKHQVRVSYSNQEWSVLFYVYAKTNTRKLLH